MKRIAFLLAFCLALFCVACGTAAGIGGAEEQTANAVPLSSTSTQDSFTDVPTDAWYAEAVAWCRENGIMSGVSETEFSPNGTMSRAMLATVLWRMENAPLVDFLMDFSDVPTGSWYTEAVRWAASEKLMEGYGGGTFGVDDPVTREQFAAVLWRYADSPASGTTDAFVDESIISPWAKDAVKWARENGIISGKGGNRFDPKANTTRAEAAMILYNFFRRQTTNPQNAKILVAYFSCTNTTESVAIEIADYLSADLFEIVPEVPYTEADLDYYSGGRADQEQADPAARPAIAGSMEDMENYDIVFLGYPIWHGQGPKIIYTFLESYDFAGKTIVPFCTSHSSGIGSSASNLHSLAPNANWLDGTRFAAGTSESEIQAWLESLEIIEKNEVSTLPYDGIYPQHEPYGTGVGAMPGRVVWTYDPDSVDWDGNGYWWELDHFDESVILNMVNDSVAALGGKETARDGWAALFTANNNARGRTGGYKAGEKIAIKANINGSAVYDDDTSGETKMSYTNPVLLKALLTSLVEEAGVAPENITVYDVSRLFPDYMVEMCTEGELRGVRFVDRDTGVADESASIVWSHEFSGKVNYLPTCVTEATYIINLANLKGHSYGITLCGKNHFGSFINGNTMRPPEGANLHQWLTRNEMGIYSPLVDLMANADLGGKTVLYMLDALICAPSEGASITGSNSRWQQAPFNGDYTSSVFASQDPVAIDSVGADFLMNEPAVTEHNSALRNNPNVENYLHEAGLIANAPSGTVYTDSQGHTVTNLGVHEHWCNSTEKLYSRNLGKSEGIELIQITK